MKNKTSLLAVVLILGMASSQNLYAQDPAVIAKNCGQRPALSLWNALNEFSSFLVMKAPLAAAGVAASKVYNKEATTDVCGMNMANLITVMTMVAKKEIFENDLNNLNAQWDAAKEAHSQVGSRPGNDYLETLSQRLDTIEAECSIKDFRIKPVLVGTALLKLHVHKLLIDSANKSFDDQQNTNSSRFYMACARAISSAEKSKERIKKINDDFENHIKKTHYILDEQVEDTIYTGKVVIILPDSSREYGPERSCATGLFHPGKREHAVRELQQLGEQLVRDRIQELRSGETDDQRKMFQEQYDTYQNFDAFIGSINSELASRNEALKKQTTGGASSYRAVDGQRSNGDPAYSFVNQWSHNLDWQVDLGPIWEACPTKIETVAFKAIVKKAVSYKVQLLDENKKIVVGCERIITVSPGTENYAVNFRVWPYGVGNAPVARYVKILSTTSSSNDYNLDEVYVFTADLAPTMTTWQSAQFLWYNSEYAVDLDAKASFMGQTNLTSSLTTAVPGKKSNWVGYFPQPISVGKIFVTSTLSGNHSYLVQFVSEENIEVASTTMKFSGLGNGTNVWSVPLSAKPARSIKITSTATNKQVGLSTVRIFKRGEFSQ